MKILVEIDEARFRDVQRIAEVQLERNHFQTAEQIIARGIPLPTDTDLNDVEPIGLYEGKEQRNVRLVT